MSGCAGRCRHFSRRATWSTAKMCLKETPSPLAASEGRYYSARRWQVQLNHRWADYDEATQLMLEDAWRQEESAKVTFTRGEHDYEVDVLASRPRQTRKSNAFLWRPVQRVCIEPTPKRATS